MGIEPKIIGIELGWVLRDIEELTLIGPARYGAKLGALVP